MREKRLIAARLQDIENHDQFWNYYINLARNVIIPYQYDLLNNRISDAHTDALYNFKVMAGLINGKYEGNTPFSDTQVTEWIEAASYQLANKYDNELNEKVDEIIDIVSRSQLPDGYVNTYHTLNLKPRWVDLFEEHELFLAGHLIEGAVAHYKATESRKFLNVAIRFADYICSVFGNNPDQIRGVPGHEEIELALYRLYQATGKTEYLNLMGFFLNERGVEPNSFSEESKRDGFEYIFKEFPLFAEEGYTYCQAHMPVRKQHAAVGHAVRAAYLYCAMVDYAYEKKDKEMESAVLDIYQDIVNRKMYITGAIGSTSYGEGFSAPYDLPNDTAYSETCASIGMMMFAQRLFETTGNARYIDTVERIFHNNIIAGTSQTGTSFFYVNPLDVTPCIVKNDGNRHYTKTQRKRWYNVACCPPNIARTLSSFNQYIIASDPENNTVYVNLFCSCKFVFRHQGSVIVDADKVQQGRVSITLSGEMRLKVRRPYWINAVTIELDGKQSDVKVGEDGYFSFCCKDNLNVILRFSMKSRLVHCNPKVKYNVGKVAVMRGPTVFCAEEVDNGKNLFSYYLCSIAETKFETICGINNVPVIYVNAVQEKSELSELYFEGETEFCKKVLRFIPYHLWANRAEGEMSVWFNFYREGKE